MDGYLLLVQPAAWLAWGLLLIIFFSVKRRQFKIAFFAFFMLVIYSATAGPLGANAIINLLEVNQSDKQFCQNIDGSTPLVILAGGMSGLTSDPEAVEKLHLDSFRRAMMGVRLAEQRKNAIAYFTGGSRGPVSEALLMSKVALKFGLSAERIRIEQASNNTYESAVNMGSLLKVTDENNLFLVTSALHMSRAKKVFEAQGLNVCAVSTDSQYLPVKFSFFALLPQETALKKTTDAMHELLGKVAYKTRGYY